jgi:hypothetical protein
MTFYVNKITGSTDTGLPGEHAVEAGPFVPFEPFEPFEPEVRRWHPLIEQEPVRFEGLGGGATLHVQNNILFINNEQGLYMNIGGPRPHGDAF